MKQLYILFFLIIALPVFAAPQGDTVGTVSAVRVISTNAYGGVSAFEIWLNNPSNDRWGCLPSKDYIVVRENASGVSPESFKMIFTVALIAHQNGKIIALDSSSIDPCTSVNTAWIID
ncbi:MAG: hypothetical protein PVG66_02250 [Chromatiales bacterium]|jgi:hypothetical protein